jgi:hypothetical protein
VTARAVPVLPFFLAGLKARASYFVSLESYMQFWANPPMFSMYQSITQSVASSTNAQITMDTLDYDSDSGRASVTPWSYTIPPGMGGRWYFGAMISWAGNATGVRISQIYKNGALINGAQEAVQAAPATNATNCFIGRTVAVSAGDAISAYGWQQSGGALNTNVANSFPSFFEGRLVSLGNP